MNERCRRRAVYVALILIVAFCGIGSRRYSSVLPELIAVYAGDTLWALAAFLGIGFLMPRLSSQRVAAGALAISFAVEFSQLYHAPWLDMIRATTLGSLILGHGFVPTDLVCYSLGVAIGWGGEVLAFEACSQTPTNPRAGT